MDLAEAFDNELKQIYSDWTEVLLLDGWHSLGRFCHGEKYFCGRERIGVASEIYRTLEGPTSSILALRHHHELMTHSHE